MGLAIISNNTTIKNAAMPAGTYTFPVNTNTDLLNCSAGQRHKINYIIFSQTSLSSGTHTLRVKSAGGTYFALGDLRSPAAGDLTDLANGSTNPNAKVIISNAGSDLKIVFDPPLELSDGQGINISNSSGGATAGARTWAAFGENTQNTP